MQRPGLPIGTPAVMLGGIPQVPLVRPAILPTGLASHQVASGQFQLVQNPVLADHGAVSAAENGTIAGLTGGIVGLRAPGAVASNIAIGQLQQLQQLQLLRSVTPSETSVAAVAGVDSGRKIFVQGSNLLGTSLLANSHHPANALLNLQHSQQSILGEPPATGIAQVPSTECGEGNTEDSVNQESEVEDSNFMQQADGSQATLLQQASLHQQLMPQASAQSVSSSAQASGMVGVLPAQYRQVVGQQLQSAVGLQIRTPSLQRMQAPPGYKLVMTASGIPQLLPDTASEHELRQAGCQEAGSDVDPVQVEKQRKRSAWKAKRKREYEKNRRDKEDPENKINVPAFPDDQIVLDNFNADLNLTLSSDGYSGKPLSDPPGFCFCWAGVRTTHGVVKGKVYFEVHVSEYLPVTFGDEHVEEHPHVLRVGWSVDSHSYQLGEDPESFGFDGTGHFCTHNKFTPYGEKFGLGDVVGALLDLDSSPPVVSFCKNGRWFGPAAQLNGWLGSDSGKALFPHVLSKNCRFEVNLGQKAAWFPPPADYQLIHNISIEEMIRGMKPPSMKAECEVLMIVGLPGAGKTTWALNTQQQFPEKRYNIVGTDTLIEKMRVMGLPRRLHYNGRWDVLIGKATACLNALFEIGSKQRRNYILDQTNVYPGAQKRKMQYFSGFYRRAIVLVPSNEELRRRSLKRTMEDGKEVPDHAILEMKTNFKLPSVGLDLEEVEFMELSEQEASALIDSYNHEGSKRGGKDNSREDRKRSSDSQSSSSRSKQARQEVPLYGQAVEEEKASPLQFQPRQPLTPNAMQQVMVGGAALNPAVGAVLPGASLMPGAAGTQLSQPTVLGQPAVMGQPQALGQQVALVPGVSASVPQHHLVQGLGGAAVLNPALAQQQLLLRSAITPQLSAASMIAPSLGAVPSATVLAPGLGASASPAIAAAGFPGLRLAQGAASAVAGQLSSLGTVPGVQGLVAAPTLGGLGSAAVVQRGVSSPVAGAAIGIVPGAASLAAASMAQKQQIDALRGITAANLMQAAALKQPGLLGAPPSGLMPLGAAAAVPNNASPMNREAQTPSAVDRSTPQSDKSKTESRGFIGPRWEGDRRDMRRRSVEVKNNRSPTDDLKSGQLKDFTAEGNGCDASSPVASAIPVRLRDHKNVRLSPGDDSDLPRDGENLDDGRMPHSRSAGDRLPGPLGPFDGPPSMFDMPRPGFDGPPRFDGPPMRFDGPMPFDGPPFDGPRFERPRGPPPRFDGPPILRRPPIGGPRGFPPGGPGGPMMRGFRPRFRGPRPSGPRPWRGPPPRP